MEISFKVTGIEEMKAKLTVLAQNEFPYAMARALTKTAQEIKKAEVDEMQRVFDRPTRWTLNSVFISPATKEKHIAEVWLKDEWAVGSSGVPAVKYLRPHIFGGERNLKRHEKALQYAGILPSGMYCVPGQGAELDAYGNMKTSQIIQIMSYFKAFGEQGYKANITDARKAKLKKGTKKNRGYEYFAIRERRGSGLKPGIYKRTGFAWGGAVKPIIMFVKRPSYQPRFDFFGVAQRVSGQVFLQAFDQAMKDALANPK
jgi:hypothetical protein